MLIRGIDFSRHSIIVGNDAETPAPGGAGSPVLPTRGDLMARVLAVAGGEATLDIGGQRVVVESHVALNAGDKLFVRIQEPKNGTVRLSILASGPESEDGLPALPDATLDGVLRDLGLPTDDRTRQAARALVARDGTVVKEDVKALVASLKQFPAASSKEAGAAALLQKAGAPVSPATVAVVLARANPEAPPQLAARLTALVPELEQAIKGAPQLTRSIQDVLKTLSGLPMDETATNAKVTEALKDWIKSLAPSPPAGEVPVGGGGTAGRQAPSALAGTSPEMGEETNLLNQATTRDDGVSRSQLPTPRLGITKGGPSPAAPDLATQLEKLGKDLGVEHKPLGHLIHEAVAELRYTQLANGPGPDKSPDQQYLVPLLVPQLSKENPEGKIQVFQRAARKGEPIDPNNVRFVFVLETEHLNTVQADMSIKDGVVDLQVGVPDAEDRAFLAEHLDQLQDAIAQLGWETGRFAARQAKGPPPRMRQEEGLTEVVRFDRRV
ncbi:MAG: hypothetical protein JWM80_1960 [Cyanobacteria bacterium RYN_339]|nr:hypothetical protein [Cyanobacteria bacterium RYN_339]